MSARCCRRPGVALTADQSRDIDAAVAAEAARRNSPHARAAAAAYLGADGQVLGYAVRIYDEASAQKIDFSSDVWYQTTTVILNTRLDVIQASKGSLARQWQMSFRETPMP
jgi:hypothetical protein